MAKTFAQMQANVGGMIIDTSSGFATLIGNWLNDKYRDIARRMPWSALIDSDYVISVTTGAGASYSLPTDFDEEINCMDITHGVALARYSEAMWWRERGEDYSAGTLQTGQPVRYMILRELSKIQLDPAPNENLTLALPYKKTITDLAGAGTVLIPDIEYIMEFGALSEAQAYKKQFAKAAYYLQKYESELAKRISQERSAPNQRYQWIPETGYSGKIGRLTGDNSYDSL